MKKSIQRMRVAIWALVFGFTVLAVSIILLVKGNQDLVVTKASTHKLPCSSETNSQCEVYVPNQCFAK